MQISVNRAIGCALSNLGEDDAANVLQHVQASVRLAKRSSKLEVLAQRAEGSAAAVQPRTKLHEALSVGSLELAYPGATRWNDAKLEQISLSEFIPVAGTYYPIVPMDNVRGGVYTGAVRWAHGKTLPISVNLNPSPI